MWLSSRGLLGVLVRQGRQPFFVPLPAFRHGGLVAAGPYRPRRGDKRAHVVGPSAQGSVLDGEAGVAYRQPHFCRYCG